MIRDVLIAIRKLATAAGHELTGSRFSRRRCHGCAPGPVAHSRGVDCRGVCQLWAVIPRIMSVMRRPMMGSTIDAPNATAIAAPRCYTPAMMPFAVGDPLGAGEGLRSGCGAVPRDCPVSMPAACWSSGAPWASSDACPGFGGTMAGRGLAATRRLRRDVRRPLPREPCTRGQSVFALWSSAGAPKWLLADGGCWVSLFRRRLSRGGPARPSGPPASAAAGGASVTFPGAKSLTSSSGAPTARIRFRTVTPRSDEHRARGVSVALATPAAKRVHLARLRETIGIGRVVFLW